MNRIECNVLTGEVELIPLTAEEIAAIPPPAPPPVPAAVSRRQFLLALLKGGFITPDEAVSAAATGAVPAILGNVIRTLSADAQVDAKVTWAAMSDVERNHPLVSAAITASGVTPDQVDNLFRLAATL
jgi:hypothetical protein